MSSRLKLSRRDAVFAGVGLLLMLLHLLVADGGFPLDDSWIHQVYARNLGDNFEWAFVSGEPSAASTSPLYTVLLSLAYLLNIPYKLWTHGLGWIALSAAGMLGARMADQIQPGRAWLGWATGLALIFCWHLLWAAASGMETMIFATFTLLLIWLSWCQAEAGSEGATTRGAVFGAASALAMCTRPEGVLLAGLCGLALLPRFFTARPAFVRWLLGAALGFALFIMPYLLLNLSLAGGLLPNTADAKFVQHAPIRAAFSFPERFWRMTIPVMAGAQFLLIPGALLFSWRALKNARTDTTALVRLLPLAWFLGLIALYALRLPASYQHGRYVIPVLPAFIVIGTLGTAELLRLGSRNAAGRVLTRTLAIAAGVAFVYFGVVTGPEIYSRDVQIIDEEMVANAQWIAQNLPPEELLAIHDIGAVGYFAPRPIVDIAGLVTPEVIDLIGDKEGLYAYMQGRGAVYLMAFPDQVPGGERGLDDERLCLLRQSAGDAAIEAGGGKMSIYRLSWDTVCPVN